MKIQKNWVGYIVWGLFSIVLFSNIGFCALKLVENGTSDFSLLVTMAISFTIVVLGSSLIIVLYKVFMKFLYHKIFVEQTDNSEENKFIIVILFVFSFLVSVIIRVIFLAAIGGEYTGDDTYYRLSMGVLTHSASGVNTNGAILYSEFLGFLFGIFGKKFQVGLISQCILQLISVFFTFMGVKKAFGKIPATITLLALAFLPGNFMAINTMDPALLFLAVFSLFFWILSLSVNENYVKPPNRFVHFCSYVVLGLFSAFLCFYDISGIVSLFLAVAFLSYRKNANNENETFEKKPFNRMLLYFIAFVVGLFFLLFFVSFNGVVGFDSVKEFFVQFIPKKGFDFYLITPTALYWDCLAPLFFASIWFFAYLKSDSSNGIPFAFSILILFVFSVLRFDIYSYDLLYNLLWAVLAGIGFKSILVFNPNLILQEKNKNDKKSRREQKELKRSIEAGEKTIQLNVNEKKPVLTDLHMEDTIKNYGIGRKESIPMPGQVPPVSTSLPEEAPKETLKNVPDESEVLAKTQMAQVPLLSKDMIPSQVNKTASVVTPMNSDHVQNNKNSEERVKTELLSSDKTQDNSIVQNNIVKHPSPMRRGYRTPSKSTFSPEELERIRQHTNGEFAYHTKEEMMKVSSSVKQEPVLKNNFINVIPDSREENVVNSNDNTNSSSVNSVEKNTEIQQDTVAKTQSGDMQTHTDNNAIASLPPLLKDKFTEEKPKLIKNPLPGPKPHVSRELTYDYNPKENEMDYDIKDLSGKDYYDL